MLKLDLSVVHDRSWWGRQRGFSVRASLVAAPENEIEIGLILEKLSSQPGFTEKAFSRNSGFSDLVPSVTHFLNDKRSDAEPLIDRRGRPGESFANLDDPEISALKRLREEEMFYSAGTLLESEFEQVGEEDELLAAAEFQEIPFVVKVHTKFETFANGTHIAHKIVKTSSPILSEISDSLSPRLIARLFPARLENVRFGVEDYSPRRFSGSLGVVPTITSRFYLEITRSTISIISHFESRQRDSLPEAAELIFTHLDQSLRETGLFPDFLAKLSENMKVS